MKALALLALWMQTAPQDPVLEEVRARLRADVMRMNRYTCRQTINRVQSGKKRLHPASCSELIQEHTLRPVSSPVLAWDRLRLDVAVTDGREVFSLAGAPKFEDDFTKIANYGAFGTGDFGPFVAQIFGPDTKIEFAGERTISGRKLRQYRYEVPKDKSSYAVRVSLGQAIVVAHSGYFLLDPQLKDVVQLTVRSQQLPEELENCQAITEITYQRVNIDSIETLIPKESRFRVIQQDGGEDVNTATYSNCREYVGESVIHFEGEADRPEQADALIQRYPIPTGLSFRARILTMIDTARSAAGDEIEGVLTSNIADDAGLIFVPVGTRVKGRLLQVSGSLSQVQIKLRLESVNLKGSVPISATNRLRFAKSHMVLKNYEVPLTTEAPAAP
jgi:hypothetical protein